ncbi:MAG: acyl-CoA thioesterase [Gammaproteobacteria bacterium]|nr:acyl-CoA thioesterase [Gammaproteobacteria bacterium]MDE2345406.1 acyl-CoA thioesterase [Gammaproteobacteria bacterium]
MNQPYRRSFQVRWADLDPNGHLRHSAYMDYAAQTRVSYLHDCGFTRERFQELHLGPILFREDTRYLHEVRANETITVTAELSGLSANGKHWRMRHQILKADGTLASVIDVQGAWLDLVSRRTVQAPVELLTALRRLPHSRDYAEFIPQRPEL